MIWFITAVLAQPTGQTAATGDTSAGFVRTELHDRIEGSHLVVRARVDTSAGVTLQGGARRWVQDLEVLEIYRQNHSRTSLNVGDTIVFFDRYDDSIPNTCSSTCGPRLPVGGEAVYFLDEAFYVDTAGTTQLTWSLHSHPWVSGYLNVTSASYLLSVITSVDYGGTTGKVAGQATSGWTLVRNTVDSFEWIHDPMDPNSTSHETIRIDPTAAEGAMSWTDFLSRVSTAAGQL
ncbi:MAG: hypothetical protein KTR31_31790 [Myxococcales bacterium]|nr:hypothetical protein [Myxococcales bacterium]